MFSVPALTISPDLPTRRQAQRNSRSDRFPLLFVLKQLCFLKKTWWWNIFNPSPPKAKQMSWTNIKTCLRKHNKYKKKNHLCIDDFPLFKEESGGWKPDRWPCYCKANLSGCSSLNSIIDLYWFVNASSDVSVLTSSLKYRFCINNVCEK